MTGETTAPALALACFLALPASGVRAEDLCFLRNTISEASPGVREVVAGDLDDDGDTDIVVAVTEPGRIEWHESDGAQLPSYTLHVIEPLIHRPNYLVITDVDGDMNVDIVASAALSNTVAWYQSDGGSPPVFTKRVIDDQIMAVRQVFASDVDGDGDIDVGAVAPNEDIVTWYANDGGVLPSWTQTILTLSLDGARAIADADLDGDDDIDIIAGPWYDDSIIWFDNDGNQPPAFTERIAHTYPDTGDPDLIAQVWNVVPADLDDDEDVDLLVARIPGVDWLENDGGTPPTFTRHNIMPSQSAWSTKSVNVADLDMDGDIDAMYASDFLDKVAWIENLGGAPPSWTEHVFSVDPDGLGPLQGLANGARSVYPADVNDDGDLDILWGSKTNGLVIWERNMELEVAACPADINGDGAVTVVDLLSLAGQWSDVVDPGCPPDIDGSGVVDVGDLLILLGTWGVCP